MNKSARPFIAKRHKYFDKKRNKLYAAYLTRHGIARVSKRFHHCKTASEAQEYAERWAERSTGILSIALKKSAELVVPDQTGRSG